jgi:transglutaminase-like putative cysteine protease/predicted glutamine amidotransferase
MSDFFAMSFDSLSSPSVSLKAFEDASTPGTAGWGLGWYPNDDNAAMIIKDPGSRKAQIFAKTLSDWNVFRSTVFLCKVRGAAKRYTQQDTQPFSRNFAGREWLFLHNGDLDKAKLKLAYRESSPFLEPLGKTDSELAFCYLLNQIHWNGAKRLADIEWEGYVKWFRVLDTFGTASIVLSDGQVMIVYHGKQATTDLFFSRRIPPHQNTKLTSEHITVDISDSLDTHKTAIFLTSCDFHEEGWQKVDLGEMLVIRRAQLIWDNLGKIQQNSLPEQSISQSQQPVLSPTLQNSQSFAASQTQQAQTSKKVVNIKAITRTHDGKPLECRFFNVTHVTKYTYITPVEKSSHLFRLQPVEDAVQEVLQSTLEISVPNEQIYFEDVFGNQAIAAHIESHYTELSIKSESHVKIYARPPDDFTSSLRRSSIPLVWMPWQRQMMLSYLMPPELPESQLRALGDFAMSIAERNDYDLLDTLNDMSQQIYRDFSYVTGSTDIETTPFDVFCSRTGVCQDFANLFICLARLLTIPARYRVGYIDTGGKYENTIQSEASHAWAEVYLPYLGWRGWDPTNGCLTAQDHVRVACGRNYNDATPTSGTIYKGGGREKISVDVKVKEVFST